ESKGFTIVAFIEESAFVRCRTGNLLRISNPHILSFCLVFSILLPSSQLGAQTAVPSTPSQVPTSAQNPIYGSVAEDKPTPGVLELTFKEAIERALRQNLAGLLSEYNTIEARGQNWQQL